MAGTSTPTLTGDGTMPIERSAPWAVCYHSAPFTAGSLAAELKAAPTRDGSALYITHITMGVALGTADVLVDCSLTVYDGASPVVWGPIRFGGYNNTVHGKDFSKPLKITDKKALDISGICQDTGYQAACFVFVEGFTGDKPIV